MLWGASFALLGHVTPLFAEESPAPNAPESATATLPTEESSLNFERGLSAMKEKRYGVACPLLARSFELAPLPGTLFTLAECEARRGRPATSTRLFRDFRARVAEVTESDPLQAERVEAALLREKELEPKLSYIVIEVAADDEAFPEVSLDGEPVAPDQWGAPLLVDPGQHRATLTYDGASREVTASVDEGRTAQLLLTLAPPPKPDPLPVEATPPEETQAAPEEPTSPPPPIDYRKRNARRGAVISYSVAGLGLATTGVASALLLANKPQLEQECDGSLCRTEDAAEKGKSVPTLSAIGTSGALVAAIGAGFGVYFTIRARRRDGGTGLRLGGSVADGRPLVTIRGQF